MRRRYATVLILAGLFLSAPTRPANGQSPVLKLPGAPPTSSVEPLTDPPVPDVKRQREDVAERLRVSQRQLDAKSTTAQPDAPATENLKREVGSLKQLEVILAQQQSAEEHRKAAEKEKADLDAEIIRLRANGPVEDKPYSFLLLDRLRDELLSETAKKDAVHDAVMATQDALARANADYSEKESVRRKAKEALELNKDEAAKAQLAATLANAELSSRLAREILILRKSEAAKEQLDQQLYGVQLDYLKDKIDWVGKNTRFTARDLQEQMIELDKQERDLNQGLESAETNVIYLEKQWFDARVRLDKAGERSPELTAEVEARRLARLVQQQKISVLGQRIERLEDRRQAWNQRLKIAHNIATKEDRDSWSDEAQQKLEQLERQRRLQFIRIDEVRKDQATLQQKSESDSQLPGEVTRWLQNQQRQYSDLLTLHERNIASVDTSRRVHEKLFNEIRGSEPDATVGDYADNLWDWVVTIWNYELAAIDDRPITVHKIVTGILLLFVGFLLSRLISRLVGARFLPRVGVHSSAAASLQSVLFYTLIVLFAVFALKVVNVPLTAFTLLGGALALGVGFGSQNVINNFISGLILLAERPIKVGDLIQLDELYGNVEQIGARSTRVKTGANLEIIVPNSSFLENNVINWTLSDDQTRTVVKVGVVYGSPTREVTRLMLKAVEEHGLVMKKPEPVILFKDFGDNSLNFEIHFWIRMRRPFDRLRIESDVRYRIDHMFREAGLVIAFPQRDVHLDTLKPLEVRLMSDAPDTTPQPATENTTPAA